MRTVHAETGFWDLERFAPAWGRKGICAQRLFETLVHDMLLEKTVSGSSLCCVPCFLRSFLLTCLLDPPVS